MLQRSPLSVVTVGSNFGVHAWKSAVAVALVSAPDGPNGPTWLGNMPQNPGVTPPVVATYVTLGFMPPEAYTSGSPVQGSMSNVTGTVASRLAWTCVVPGGTA